MSRTIVKISNCSPDASRRLRIYSEDKGEEVHLTTWIMRSKEDRDTEAERMRQQGAEIREC